MGEHFIRGSSATPTIIALLKVGLFEALVKEKVLNIESFASQNRLNLKVLTSLCDYLYALKVFDREGLNYSLSPKGQLLTDMLQGSF